MALGSFLLTNTLGNHAREIERIDGLALFREFLPAEVDPIWPQLLGRLTGKAPWRFWSLAAVREALAVLERDPERSTASLHAHSRPINIGLTEWLRQAAVHEHEIPFSTFSTREIVRLATEHHPEYGRRAEHVFANLLRLYWGVLKKKSVDGAFDLRGALAVMNSKGSSALTRGYVDDVRNAITHGEVVFAGSGIRYGPRAGAAELTAGDFLHVFDELWVTANSLALGLLIFLARLGPTSYSVRSGVPLQVSALLAETAAGHPGLSIQAIAESDYPATGSQLHLAISTELRSRTACLFDCARLSAQLIRYGVTDHRRHLFDITHPGRTLSSMVIIDTGKLAALLSADGTVERLPEIFHDPVLLWYDEGRTRTLLRAWRLLLPSALSAARRGALSAFHGLKWYVASGRYRLRYVENRSVGRVIRVHVTAVLRESHHAEDRIIVRAVLRNIIQRVKRQRFRSAGDDTAAVTFSSHGRPKYVWVSLYKQDATVRELARGGWLEGNLVATAEWVRGWGGRPIFVPNAQEVWRGVRLQYTLDPRFAHLFDISAGEKLNVDMNRPDVTP